MPNGRICFIRYGSAAAWYSDDDGASWARADAAFPEASQKGAYAGVQALIQNGALVIPVNETKFVYQSTSGISFAKVNIQSLNIGTVDDVQFNSNSDSYFSVYSGKIIAFAAPYGVNLSIDAGGLAGVTGKRSSDVYWPFENTRPTQSPMLTSRGWINCYANGNPMLAQGTGPRLLKSNMRFNGTVLGVVEGAPLFFDFDGWGWADSAAGFGFLPSGSLAVERIAIDGNSDLSGFAPETGFVLDNTGHWNMPLVYHDGAPRRAFYLWDHDYNEIFLIEAYRDATKFNAPGLSAQGGATPYVYAGA
jgi:hypothetical protein